MAVSYTATSESHGEGLSSSNELSFSWTHNVAGTPKGVLVFTFVNANADDATSVTYGGATVNAVPSGRANSATTPGDCKAWFLGSGLPSGNQTVVVNRTNNANAIFAVAITFAAATDTTTAGVVLETADGTVLTQKNVDDGSPGADSLRVAAVNTGFGDINAAVKVTNNNVLPGPNSKWIDDTTILYAGVGSGKGMNDYGSRVVGVVKEQTAGQGSRPVGFGGTYLVVPSANTGIAAVYLAVTETGGGGGGGTVGSAAVLLPSIVTNRIPITGMGGIPNNRVYRF